MPVPPTARTGTPAADARRLRVDGGCGIFACPNVNYNGGSIAWNQPTTTMQLIAGGIRASVTLPNVRLTVRACGTT